MKTKILTFPIGLKPGPCYHNVIIMIGSTITQLMKNHENLNSHESTDTSTKMAQMWKLSKQDFKQLLKTT